MYILSQIDLLFFYHLNQLPAVIPLRYLFPLFLLKTANYEVISILNPNDALVNLEKFQPALILLDINMPEINGYDLCAMLRRNELFQRVPIIMLTGRDGMLDRIRAKLVGATDYMTKPFEPEQLINCITKHLSKQDQEINKSSITE